MKPQAKFMKILNCFANPADHREIIIALHVYIHNNFGEQSIPYKYSMT